MGEQDGRLAVGQHVYQAVFRVCRVQRYVGATGFENAEQADDHLDGSLDADADQCFRPDVHAAQSPG